MADRRESVFGLHFYQPPRRASHESLSYIKTDPHGMDWTEIIFNQTYKPLAEMNVIGKTSFDMYATLRFELDRLNPEIATRYRETMKTNGIGDSFIHVILPDVSVTDKRILIGAGAKQFRKETGTSPQWFWPAESAIDTETLVVLSEYGYKGIICAPEQVRRDDHLPPDDRITKIRLPNGNTILALAFDRPISTSLALAPKNNADDFTRSFILPRFGSIPSHMIFTYTDAETFGHHWRFGGDFVNYLLDKSLPGQSIYPDSINNRDLDNEQAGTGVIIERTAWSCSHGDLARWHGACPCGSGDLRWKTPFYQTFAALHRNISGFVANEIGSDYQQLLMGNFAKALFNRGNHGSSPELSLLSAAASSLSARTSCGTFFDSPHVSGRINILLAQQSIRHLYDSGEHAFAASMENLLRYNLTRITDPTCPDRSLYGVQCEMADGQKNGQDPSPPES